MDDVRCQYYELASARDISLAETDVLMLETCCYCDQMILGELHAKMSFRWCEAAKN